MELYFKFKLLMELVPFVIVFPFMVYRCFEWLKLKKKIEKGANNEIQKETSRD